ncbi:galactose mutarotase-like enzyme [Mycoplana sp. BE70]|uniref:hypothetical protein n=1 Tax=Mycoplana sp. BE70 TaxID=2817775 RepID=UPI00285F0DDD|nr:hypothetical protein [Mycoplana sp. BE70]MDR6758719.1 galactose mutarotase-like enzyme [Mycoplana sp. BE70]
MTRIDLHHQRKSRPKQFGIGNAFAFPPSGDRMNGNQIASARSDAAQVSWSIWTPSPWFVLYTMKWTIEGRRRK